MSLARPALVTEEEFLALPETMGRVELLDGEVIVAPCPSAWHQEILGRLVLALRTWVEELWIVEPSGVVERWRGPGLSQAEELTQSLTSPVLAGFQLDLSLLFRMA